MKYIILSTWVVHLFHPNGPENTDGTLTSAFLKGCKGESKYQYHAVSLRICGGTYMV